ncbi:MAG: response regulator [Actinomycetota bacterium]
MKLRKKSRWEKLSKGKVLIADGEMMFAESLGVALALKHERFQILGQYPVSVRELLDAVVLEKPEVVILDYWMPLEGGPAATRKILLWEKKTKVLLTSWDQAPEYVENTLKAGAVGFLPKGISLALVAGAIDRAAAGEVPVYKESLMAHMDHMRTGQQDVRKHAERVAKLTIREIEVLGLLSVGNPIEWVANELGITVGTVNRHIHKVLTKTSTRSYPEAVALARRFGILLQGPSTKKPPGRWGPAPS